MQRPHPDSDVTKRPPRQLVLARDTKPENKCSDCLYLDATTRCLDNENLQLVITLFFNYQKKEIINGSLRFGLCGGDLRVIMDGAELKKFLITSNFNWFVDKTTKRALKHGATKVKSSSNQHSLSLSTTAPSVANAITESKSESKSLEIGLEDEATFESWQVTALAGDQPGWRFVNKTGQAYLEGNIEEEAFAEIVARDEGSAVEIIFTAEQKDVHVDVTSGLLWSKGPRNWLEFRFSSIYLWHKIVKPLMTPYLSRVVLKGKYDA